MQPIGARVYGALFAVYIIWGSSYLAMRIAIEGFPPLLMAAIRHSCAGLGLFIVLVARGAKLPTLAQWRGGALTGCLLLVGGNGGVALAERSIASSLAAIVVATMPLWTAVIGIAYQAKPTRREMVGLAIGFAGVVVLSGSEGLIGGDVVAFVALCISPISWAWGSVATRRVALAPGAMGSATQMLSGGTMLFAIGLAHGDHFAAVPPLRSVIAVAYLIVLGSLVGFIAYGYLLRTTRPAFATSYAYVNPIVAIALGVMFANEMFTPRAAVATALTLLGVALMVRKRP
jgi:drug/metabolite transporter (DMT)-like permease